ncbi:MAG: response regulator [Nitrospirae bacterium]|nr:response regulator [Nitrospirota bacterium]
MRGDADEKETNVHKQILLVDDDLSSRQLIASVFEKSGYVVNQTDRGEEAFSMIENNNYGYALVFIDLEIPDMSGFTLVKQLKKFYMDIPFFVVSGFSDKMIIMEMLQRDCNNAFNRMIRDSRRSAWGW